MPIASKTEPSSTTEPGAGEVARAASGPPAASAVRPPRSSAEPRKSVASCSNAWAAGPKLWQRAWWEERFISATLDDPLVRVQLFRFIDALPALRTTETIRRHLAEYLAEAGDCVPWWLRLGLALAPVGSIRSRWLAAIAQASAGAMARKFIAGATPAEAMQTVLALRRRRRAFTADLLGEAVISEVEADLYQETCLAMLRGLAGPVGSAPEIALIDRDQHGPIPRVNLSLKLSSLTANFEPIHAEATIEHVARRLRPILRTARELGAYIHVDMEQYNYRALSYELFCRVLAEPEFRDWPDVGIVVQAYHADAERELHELCDWALRRGTPITIRLVKGAYWDYEVFTARRLGWPEPVYLQKWQSDAGFERRKPLLAGTSRGAAPGFRQPQCSQPGSCDRGGRGTRATTERLRAPDPLRYGRLNRARRGRPRPPGAGLYALWRDAARHGVSRPAAAREHVERIVLEGKFYRESAHRRAAARSPGDRSHVDPLTTDEDRIASSGRPRGSAAVSQRAADRFRPRRKPRGDA